MKINHAAHKAPFLQEIAADPPLLLQYLPGRSERLVVSLAGVGNKRSVQPPCEFYKMASQGGLNHVLFVSDASRSWLNGPNIAARIIAAIEETKEKVNAKCVVALGNSMGATMALHLASITRIDAVIAVVPQFSVHPKHVPEEARWTFYRKKIKSWAFESIEYLPTDHTDIIILHGGSPDELVHLNRFPRDKKARHFVFPELGHSLASHLQEQKKLKPIIKHAVAGQRWKLRLAIKNAGGISRRAFDASRAQAKI